VRVMNTDFAREMNRQTGGMVVALRRAANNRDEAHRLGSRGEATGALLVGLTILSIVRYHPDSLPGPRRRD
jgi:hypothetical protein